LAPAVRRAATRTGARTAVAEETVKADMIPGESGCEVFRSRSIDRDARDEGARVGGVRIRALSIYRICGIQYSSYVR
jgi:hypothetical protein